MLSRIRSRLVYLAPPVAIFLLIFGVYAYTKPYPALGGGLYLMMAETIGENGYRLPARIPYYTSEGIPFGYPPLMLYVASFLIDIGISKISIARFFPVIPLSASLISYYYFAEELLENPPGAALAAIIVGTSPAILQYTISAGGFVRATALMFTIIGLYTGVKLFKTDSWYWASWSIVLFGLTVLTHPKYTLSFGTSYLVFYLWFDRTVSGLLRGISVALGGLLLAAPWWLSVATVHGFEIFLQASETHGGIGRLFGWVFAFLRPLTTPISFWPVLVAISGIYLVARGRRFLPLWFLIIGFVVGDDEPLMLVGALMVSILVFDGVVPTVSARWPSYEIQFSKSSIPIIFFIIMISIYAVGSASLFVKGGENFESFFDEKDIDAMKWVQQETAQDSSFIIIGDVGEWFPLFAHRTNSVATRGTEWTGNYGDRIKLRKEIWGCLSAKCITSVIERNDLNPDYIYVARDGYVVAYQGRIISEERWEYLRPSLNDSDDYELVFENNDVIIFEYTKRSGD